MVLKEACDVLDQLRMIYQKVLIESRYISGIGGSRILDKNLQGLQLEECGFMCIIKAGINDKKGHLILLVGFLEHCGWVWDRKTGGISNGGVTWCIRWGVLSRDLRRQARGFSTGREVIWFRM